MRRAGMASTGVVLLVAQAVLGETLYVNGETGNDAWDGLCEEWDGAACGPKATIQAGIDAAEVGDTVIVADGVYARLGNKNLDFWGKDITLRSESGRESCIIDCEGSGRAFHFYSGETAASVVEGFTIRNGHASRGGGIYCEGGSSPTFTSCTIRGSTADAAGGLYCKFGSPTISDCVIERNLASDGSGGGAWFYDASPTLIGCTISENEAAGLYPYGGGVDLSQSEGTLVDCELVRNVSGEHGGAIFCYSSSPTVVNCRIVENSAGTVGGAMYCNRGSPTVTNCLTVGNTAADRGGAIYCFASRPTFLHCTFTGNYSPNGRALGCNATQGNPAAVVTMANCILWDGGGECWISGNSTVTITNSDVYGGFFGEGNIDADPAFAFGDDLHLMAGSPCIDAGTNEPPGGLPADDFEGTPRPLDGDGDLAAVADMGAYEFSLDAPCIGLSPEAVVFDSEEGGSNPADEALSIRNCGGGTLNWQIDEGCSWLTALPESGESVGEVDVVSLRADISGLEAGSYPCVVWVSDAQGVNSPRAVLVTLVVRKVLLVPSEYETIQGAIDAAVDGNVVIVADGVCTGGGNKNLDFHGKGIIVRSENGPESCTIDCEGSGCGFRFLSGESATSVVDGFTIRDGSGGIVCGESSPTIVNCVIMGHVAAYGGGVYCRDNSSPSFTDCVIIGNRAQSYGGGVSCYEDSSPVFTRCEISQNRTYDGGGIRCSQDSSPTFIECTIARNVARNTGGGGYFKYGSNPTFVDCEIAGNSAWDTGGMCFRTLSEATLVGCVISGNSATRHGGGIYCGRYGSLTLINCAVTGNQGERGGGVYTSSPATLTSCTIAMNAAAEGRALARSYGDTGIANCVLWNGGDEIWSSEEGSISVAYSDVTGGWPGEGNIDADPLFVDPEGAGDDPDTFEDNDYRLGLGSPCVDAGDNNAVAADELDLDGDGTVDEPVPFDLGGNPRFVDDPVTPDSGNGRPPIVDMGAYEFQVERVWLDIKPGSCPNVVALKREEIVRVAVVGAAAFDVTQINVRSLVLTRADGVGGGVRPLAGPAGPGIQVKDVATPFEGEPCACHDLGGDGIDDLSMEFDTEALVIGLELEGLLIGPAAGEPGPHEFPGGTSVALVISGELLDGGRFGARDCIRLVAGGPGFGGRRVEAAAGDREAGVVVKGR